MARTTEFVVTLENKPGMLAGVAEALASAGVNIDGMAAHAQGSDGVVAVVTNNPNGTGQALQGAGFKYTTREVLVVTLENKPGALAKLARALADANINIDAGHILMNGKMVIGAADIAAAEEVANKLGVA